MKLDTNKSKKRRKVSENIQSETHVKNKKIKNDGSIETSSSKEIGNEDPDNFTQKPPPCNGNKKEKKKKKRKIDETAENFITEKKSKINGDAAATSEITQNGVKSNSVEHNDPGNEENSNEEEEEDDNEKKISKKESIKLSAKSLRKSFNARDGMDALRKFLAVCKENKQRDLVSEYLQAGGSVLEILRLLDTSDKKNLNNACTVFSAMHLVIMKILSEYPQYQSNAEEACRHFINSHLSFVHSMLSSQSNAKHRKVVLRLLASMVSLGGNLPRELLAHLSFHSQVLDTLSQQTKPTDSQSVRTCLLHFILAFLVEGNSTVIRALLEKRGMLSCIFPELIYDSHTTVHLVLNTVKNYVLENPAISKTSKLHVFSTPVMQSLVSLYNWKGPKNWPGPKGKKRDTSKDIVNPEEKEIAVEAVHDFLITLLTSTRHGVIFNDRSLGTSGRKHNQLVNTVLQSLDRPWEHARPLDLVVRVLVACPDLVRSQLNYTEPFLEPRASKKWIQAMRFVGQLIESQSPETCLKPCLTELAGPQLFSAVTNLTLPQIVVKSAIQSSIIDANATIRHEAIILLEKMLKQARAFSTIVEENSHEIDRRAFRNSMIDYASKNLPNLETVLKIWNLSLSPDEINSESVQEEIIDFVPNRREELSSILDLLQAYRDFGPEILDLGTSGDLKASALLTSLNDLPEIEEEDLRRMKLKALKFLLVVDLPAFAPSENLFGQTIEFLIKLLDRVDDAEDSRDTMKMLLRASGIFETCEEQMDIWINAFQCLKLEEERILAASWFVKIVKQAIKRTDKYLGMIVEAEESAGEIHLDAARLEEIFNDLTDRDSTESRIANVAPFVAISPIFCSAVSNLRKNPNDAIAKYMSYVTILTLHCQVSPGTLINLARSVDNLPAEDYLRGWLPEEFPISIPDDFFISTITRFSEILLSEENIEIEKIFEGERIVEFHWRDEKKILRHGLEKYDVGILLRIAVFYTTQFLQRGKLEERKFDHYKLCICALLHIAKNSGDIDFARKCSNVIFTHPTILQYFSPIGKSNDVKKFVTAGLIDIFRTIICICDSVTLLELFAPFKNKLLSQLRSAIKKCKDGGKVKKRTCLIEFVEILRPTSQEMIDILGRIVELPRESFLSDKNSLSIWANLVPKFLEMLTLSRNSSRDTKIETTIVKKIASHLTQLKVNRKISTESWEINLQNYLKIYPHNISGIDGHFFNSLMKFSGSSTTTNLLAFLVSRNDQYIPLFVRFVTNNPKILAQSDLIFSVLASNLTYSWDKDFVNKIHSHYKKDILRYFSEPANDTNWVARNVKATIFLIDSCFEIEDCAKACEIVLSNGDKLDNVDMGYVELLETLFKKTSRLEENSEDALTKLVQVLIRIIVSALKKDSKNEEKLEKLCQCLNETIKLLKTENSDFVFEDLSKNYSWPQFTRFSLKIGLKISKDDKKQVPLLRTLVNVCDVAYADASENEYVKTLFEMTTSHSEFVNLMLSSHQVKRDLLELLWVLVRKNHSTMSSSQIPLYLAAYNATLQESDQFILLILQHYETNGIKFNEYRPYLWGEAAATHYSVKGEADTALWRQPSTSQVLDLFNPEIVKETIKNFPVHRDLKPSGIYEAGRVYDPSFYLPLVTYLLSDNNVVACHRVTKSGALALVFAATGSSCPKIRLAAYTAISRFYFHLEATSSKEKQLWIRFVDALRNGMNNMESTLEGTRMSCLVSTFLARTSLVTTEPLNVLYSPLQAFLMAKPAMELTTIPELLQLFHSSEIEHRAHRHWILGVVRDGMKTSFDMDIALKCYLFKMLMDFYTSVLSDPETKRLILEVIESTVKIPKAGLLLTRNHSLLVWLNEVTCNLNSRDTDRIDIVVSIVRETLKDVLRTKNQDREAKFSLLNVLKSLKKCLSKNTCSSSFNDYASSLCELFRTKGFRDAMNRQDMTEIVDLGNAIFGDVEDIVEILLHGGEFSGKMENLKNEDDATISRENLRKLVLIWRSGIVR